MPTLELINWQLVDNKVMELYNCSAIAANSLDFLICEKREISCDNKFLPEDCKIKIIKLASCNFFLVLPS